MSIINDFGAIRANMVKTGLVDTMTDEAIDEGHGTVSLASVAAVAAAQQARREISALIWCSLPHVTLGEWAEGQHPIFRVTNPDDWARGGQSMYLNSDKVAQLRKEYGEPLFQPGKVNLASRPRDPGRQIDYYSALYGGVPKHPRNVMEQTPYNEHAVLSSFENQLKHRFDGQLDVCIRKVRDDKFSVRTYDKTGHYRYVSCIYWSELADQGVTKIADFIYEKHVRQHNGERAVRCMDTIGPKPFGQPRTFQQEAFLDKLAEDLGPVEDITASGLRERGAFVGIDYSQMENRLLRGANRVGKTFAETTKDVDTGTDSFDFERVMKAYDAY
jgi:hypothetical protein